MGIFGDIMSKIFGQSAKAETPAARTAEPRASTAPQVSPTPSGTVTRTGPAPRVRRLSGRRLSMSKPCSASLLKAKSRSSTTISRLLIC